MRGTPSSLASLAKLCTKNPCMFVKVTAKKSVVHGVPLVPLLHFHSIRRKRISVVCLHSSWNINILERTMQADEGLKELFL